MPAEQYLVAPNLAPAIFGFQFRPSAVTEFFGHADGAGVEADVIPFKAGKLAKAKHRARGSAN
jgi:hypothetical protein